MSNLNLLQLYDLVIAGAKKQADWYSKAKTPVKRMSRTIRFMSVVLFGLGGLFPILGGILKQPDNMDITSWGYVCIAVAGTLVFLDRFFGYSSGWIRYITAETEIRNQIKEFEMRWRIETCGLDLTAMPCDPRGKEIMKLLADFSTLIDELVKQETKTWAAEFQSNITELQKTINAKIETLTPGAIKIVVTNGRDYNPLKARIDTMTAVVISGDTALFTGVSVGHHLVVATGVKDGKQVEAAEVAVVDAGKLVTVEVKMP